MDVKARKEAIISSFIDNPDRQSREMREYYSRAINKQVRPENIFPKGSPYTADHIRNNKTQIIDTHMDTITQALSMNKFTGISEKRDLFNALRSEVRQWGVGKREPFIDARLVSTPGRDVQQKAKALYCLSNAMYALEESRTFNLPESRIKYDDQIRNRKEIIHKASFQADLYNLLSATVDLVQEDLDDLQGRDDEKREVRDSAVAQMSRINPSRSADSLLNELIAVCGLIFDRDL